MIATRGAPQGPRERELTAIDTAGLLAGADAVTSIVRKVPMRYSVLAIVAIVSVSAAGSARAQKYDPDFPFCMHVYERRATPWEDCSYYTMAQCRASASGRGFGCDPNPYYAGPPAAPERHARKHRRVDRDHPVR